MLEVFAGFPDLEPCDTPSEYETRSFQVKSSQLLQPVFDFVAFPNPILGEVLILRAGGPIVGVDHFEIRKLDGTTIFQGVVLNGESEIVVDARILSLGENLICLVARNGLLIQTIKVLRK
jgi:hypothetical protein